MTDASTTITTSHSQDPLQAVVSLVASLAASVHASLKERGEKINELMATAPEQGANLWKLSDAPSQTTVYLLGTMHGNLLGKMARRKQLVTWLNDTKFGQVYAELADTPVSLDVPAIKAAIDTLDKLEAPSTEDLSRLQKLKRAREIQENHDFLEGLGKLDKIYTSLAAKGTPILGLETQELRAEVRSAYGSSSLNQSERKYGDSPELANSVFGLTDANLGVEEDPLQAARDADRPEAERKYALRNKRVTAKVQDMVTSGNEKQLMGIHSQHLRQGIDVQDIEERNRRWIQNKTRGQYHPGDTLLWVVGVSHLGGLIIDLRDLGWQVESFAP